MHGDWKKTGLQVFHLKKNVKRMHSTQYCLELRTLYIADLTLVAFEDDLEEGERNRGGEGKRGRGRGEGGEGEEERRVFLETHSRQNSFYRLYRKEQKEIETNEGNIRENGYGSHHSSDMTLSSWNSGRKARSPGRALFKLPCTCGYPANTFSPASAALE